MSFPCIWPWIPPSSYLSKWTWEELLNKKNSHLHRCERKRKHSRATVPLNRTKPQSGIQFLRAPLGYFGAPASGSLHQMPWSGFITLVKFVRCVTALETAHLWQNPLPFLTNLDGTCTQHLSRWQFSTKTLIGWFFQHSITEVLHIKHQIYGQQRDARIQSKPHLAPIRAGQMRITTKQAMQGPPQSHPEMTNVMAVS